MHHHTIVLYVEYKCDEKPSIGYLVMEEDGRMDKRAEGRTDGFKKLLGQTDGQRRFICFNNSRI